MIEIKDKAKCSGCSACMAVCGVNAIAMKTDREGFAYPVADASVCVECGACVRVCPELNPDNERTAQATFAGRTLDDATRMESSSGGIFSALATAVLAGGGVVYGAAFSKDWNVGHIRVDNADSLGRLRGSKYLQSHMGNSLRELQDDLRQGRKVLFTGTPCQVAGVLKYLRKPYENLYTAEVVCHGVPSPAVWQTYLSNILSGVRDAESIQTVSFRDKSDGGSWSDYRLKLTLRAAAPSVEPITLVNQHFGENVYVAAFLRNLSLRPACYECPFKSGRSGADIALGDFWGIQEEIPQLHDEKGVSLVVARTEKGLAALGRLNDCRLEKVEYDAGLRHNPALEHSVARPEARAFFFAMLRLTGNVGRALGLTISPNPFLKKMRELFR